MSGRLDEILEQLRDAVARMTEAARQSSALAAEHMAQMRNDVLWSGSGVIGADGSYSRQSARAPFAAVVVHNISAHTLVVADQGASQQPSGGPGVWQVPAGQSVTCPLLGTAVTVWGTAGDTFNLAMLARLPASVGRTA